MSFIEGYLRFMPSWIVYLWLPYFSLQLSDTMLGITAIKICNKVVLFIHSLWFSFLAPAFKSLVFAYPANFYFEYALNIALICMTPPPPPPGMNQIRCRDSIPRHILQFRGRASKYGKERKGGHCTFPADLQFKTTDVDISLRWEFATFSVWELMWLLASNLQRPWLRCQNLNGEVDATW